jgi:hypothetical protein
MLCQGKIIGSDCLNYSQGIKAFKGLFRELFFFFTNKLNGKSAAGEISNLLQYSQGMESSTV